MDVIQLLHTLFLRLHKESRDRHYLPMPTKQSMLLDYSTPCSVCYCRFRHCRIRHATIDEKSSVGKDVVAVRERRYTPLIDTHQLFSLMCFSHFLGEPAYEMAVSK